MFSSFFSSRQSWVLEPATFMLTSWTCHVSVEIVFNDFLRWENVKGCCEEEEREGFISIIIVFAVAVAVAAVVVPLKRKNNFLERILIETFKTIYFYRSKTLVDGIEKQIPSVYEVTLKDASKFLSKRKVKNLKNRKWKQLHSFSKTNKTVLLLILYQII